MSKSFWETVSIYCNHLAPAAGPLLVATGSAAEALHRAECETRELESKLQYLKSIGPSDIQDPDGI